MFELLFGTLVITDSYVPTAKLTSLVGKCLSGGWGAEKVIQ